MANGLTAIQIGNDVFPIDFSQHNHDDRYVTEDVTYSQLKTYRDNGTLIPGKKYRITDYVTTTTQENTTSDVHPFDIIVEALDESTLSENASAIKRENDTYFNTENLEAWQLKYCLDNDTNRFGWADATNGKGVIYHMIDEWNNECPYDFKNIKFYNSDLGTSVYTFTWINENSEVMDSSIFGNNGTLTYYGEIYGVYGNVIKPYMEMIYKDSSDSEYSGPKQLLNNITFISNYEYDSNGNDGFYGCHSNSFGNNCYNNILGDECYINSFGNYCSNNSFGNSCSSNSFGNSCSSNSFGNICSSNSFGNICSSNSFGNGCYNNSFGNNCYNNILGDGCNINSFGISCSNNSFGNYCSNNSFGISCSSNSFRLTASKTSTLLNYCYHNHFDDGCSYNVIWNNVQPTNANKLQNINIARGISGTVSAYNFINIVDKNAAYEIKVAKNTSGDIKIYCEADLIK